MSTPTYQDLPGGRADFIGTFDNLTRREKLQSNYFFLCGCVKCKHASGREREATLGGKKEKEVAEKKRRQRGRK